MNQSLIWIDGQYHEYDDARIAALSQTFHYGFGVYEGVRSYETKDGIGIFRLMDHTDRLFQSAQILNINIPYKKNMLNEIQHEILEKNHLKNAYIRPVVFMGDEFLGLHTQKTSVHVMIAAIEWKSFFINKSNHQESIAIKISSYERLKLKNNLHKAKANGLYLISILANNEAKKAGFDEALMLDPDGFIAEGTGANLFIVKNNCLYTPFLNFALDGITRRTVMQIVNDLQLSVIEKNITLAELYSADEIFFTGTAAEVLAVTKIEDQIIASGRIGNITKKIQQCYYDIVTGKSEQYRHWLSFSESNCSVG